MPKQRNGGGGVDLEGFFAGVDEARAYLDRELQDPSRRRSRLRTIALELLDVRGARALADSEKFIAMPFGPGGAMRPGAGLAPDASRWPGTVANAARQPPLGGVQAPSATARTVEVMSACTSTPPPTIVTLVGADVA